jgi:hypothetical protein
MSQRNMATNNHFPAHLQEFHADSNKKSKQLWKQLEPVLMLSS